jgi:hypothetical protein
LINRVHTIEQLNYDNCTMKKERIRNNFDTIWGGYYLTCIKDTKAPVIVPVQG